MLPTSLVRWSFYIARISIVCAASLLVFITPPSFCDPSLTILHSFADGSVSNDGQVPSAGLVSGGDGFLYGTTGDGGVVGPGASSGGGTAFKTTPAGAVTILHSFGDGTVLGDGLSPQAPLIVGPGEILYGTCFGGGAEGFGGTVFQITTSGTEKVLHSFESSGADGIICESPVLLAPDGSLYGTTLLGGVNSYGIVYKLATSAKQTILHSFQDPAVRNDGLGVPAGLTLGADGNFYGATDEGGAGESGISYIPGVGTIYKITPTGSITILHSFGDGSVANDGWFPYVPPIEDGFGNWFGTTANGGSTRSADPQHYGFGTAYRMTSAGEVTILHSFGDGSVLSDGQEVYAPIIRGGDGNFYGTTREGGAAGQGTIFRMTPTGQVTILHSFLDGSIEDDGAWPNGLMRDTDGSYYGTTSYGGSTISTDPSKKGFGTIFKLIGVELPPVISSFTPHQGPPGTLITVVGQNLNTATAAAIGAVAANKITPNWKGNRLDIIVPKSAISGKFSVSTPIGTATSASKFTVTNDPLIASFTPHKGASGTVITVVGTNFTGASAVAFQGAAATTFHVNAAGTQLTVPVPSGAQTGTFSVTTPNGVAESPQSFTVVP